MNTPVQPAIAPHHVPPEYAMDAAFCARAAKVIGWVLKRIALSVKHAGGTEHIAEGDIFVFNHFTRFETVIVSWLLLRHTGRFVRAIADKSLFRVAPWFSKLLKAVGAVPNTMEGLLPFMAAEIMRGNKVVIFPEGGIIKDLKMRNKPHHHHHVMFGINPAHKRQHRGAAVLALAVDIFKHHLRTLEAKGDMATLMQWCNALQIPTMTELLKQAHKPTAIVPGNITYFPIRTGENWLSGLLNRFLPEAPQQALEELIIEGNILFKSTDMDINFGAPIAALPTLSASEKQQLKSTLDGLTNLHQLFVHKTEEITPATRPLATLLHRHSDTLTNTYATAIYAHTTLNMNHLVSSTIQHLIKHKWYEIPHSTFHTALYLAIKKIHAAGNLHLHCSLHRPWFYHGLTEGQAPSFKGFMKNCAKLHLLKRAATTYKFSHRLDDEFDEQDIRLENPIAMHANEASPIPQLQQFIREALAEADTVTQPELAYHLMDDMQRAHRLRHQFWVHRTPEWAPTRDDPTRAMPYLLEAKGRTASPTAVVLVHGFTAHPLEVKNLATKLHAQGHTVVGVCLFGHGTTPLDLERRNRHEWLQGVMQGYKVAAGLAPKVALVGFSTGGALALTLAGKHTLPQLAGIASIASPVTVRDKTIHILPFVMPVLNLLRRIITLPNALRFYPTAEPIDGLHYPVKPVTGLNELRLLMAELPAMLPAIKTSVLLLQGTADLTVEPSSVEILFQGLTNAEREKHVLEGGPHGLIYEDFGPTHTLVLNFLKRIST
ncbi:MAG: alpha/beta fold hydrolase [Alphaproteobacteria bacterium]